MTQRVEATPLSFSNLDLCQMEDSPSSDTAGEWSYRDVAVIAGAIGTLLSGLATLLRELVTLLLAL